MPLQATSGAASYDAFGGGVAAVPNYIEECFSTTLYTGNGSTQTITNGIDLSTKGGLTWIKHRTSTFNHRLYDTVRGATKELYSNLTDAQTTDADGLTAFNSNGFSVGSANGVNQDTVPFASWTFRKQPKFFDVVTYTGNSTSGRTIAHNLGSVPGCIIVKCTSDATAWAVYHRSLGGTKWVRLNTTDASVSNSTIWNNTDPTATEFTVGNAGTTNQSTQTYVAYLFAHDAGGFGLTGTDNVISCGSFNTDGAGMASVSLGYEPQFLIYKRTNITGNWQIVDNMRGMSVSATTLLYANKTDADITFGPLVIPTATGFNYEVGDASNTYIYIAIRRGPMKVPTSGTSVFAPVSYSGTSGTNFISSGFTVDAEIVGPRTTVRSWKSAFASRLTGTARYLTSSSTAAEQTDGPSAEFAVNNGVLRDGTGMNSTADTPLLTYMMQRAPSFFDEVCYTGTGSTRTVTHNLGVVPELMIVKARSQPRDWLVYSSGLTTDYFIVLNSSAPQDNSNYAYIFGNNTVGIPPTSSVFTVGSGSDTNANGSTYVAYLFASCPNVSKVTTYTGNGSSQTINCGFTSGARFVMIKRVDSTGNWVTFDTARGIVSGNDPALYLNSTAAEVTGVDAIDPDSTGFIVNQESTFNLNVSSATYLVLAIA